MTVDRAEPVTLDTCADEPIHLLGNIQSHGAMLVFNREHQLRAWSLNAPALLKLSLTRGLPLAAVKLAPAVREMVNACIADTADGESAHMATATTIGDSEFDCIVHSYLDQIFVEYEQRAVSSESVGMFAVKAHSGIARLSKEKTVVALLQRAAEQVRALTGFDRVMGYRFRHDDSGEVAAEARTPELPPLLGMRYPASDIPAQARRLYIINTLRLISDVNQAPVPMVGAGADGPVDMSQCVLRSVSPIHIEYLQNMGVGASMSISIVVNGKLWGMLACHHMAPKQVPYAIRMALDVMVQVLGAKVQAIEARERAHLIEQALEVRTRLMQGMVDDEDSLISLAGQADSLCATLASEALIVSQYGRIITHGGIEPAVAAVIVASLASLAKSDEEFIVRQARDEWPADLRADIGKWVGMLALSFDPATGGWVVLLRAEQSETVRWAGKPEKIAVTGPNGARLTPRGSFDEWRQTVIGLCKPWAHTHIIIARQLMVEMQRASMTRYAETERAREQLFAMLGHDLRDPLNAISMAANVLQLGGDPKNLGQRISASSKRMGRMVGQILDMSRIEGGRGLGMTRTVTDLHLLVVDIVDECRTGYPAIRYLVDAESHVLVNADGDRLTQVIGNLLSNARNHGDAAYPIDIGLHTTEHHAVLSVRNVGVAIDDELAMVLYDPFKRASLDNARNRGGMGLGLHIVQKIVLEHGGHIAYRYAAPHVVFTVTLPLAR